MTDRFEPVDAESQFFSASDARVARALAAGEQPDDKSARSQAVNQAVKRLATAIGEVVPVGRQRSIALTELESVQMRSNRGIFSTE